MNACCAPRRAAVVEGCTSTLVASPNTVTEDDTTACALTPVVATETCTGTSALASQCDDATSTTESDCVAGDGAADANRWVLKIAIMYSKSSEKQRKMGLKQ